MKEIEKIIMVMIVIILCLGTVEVKALILNNGAVHTVDWTIDEPVSVEDSPGGDFTTLNLVDGGSISLWLNALDNSEINIFGGAIQDDLWTYHYSQTTISAGSITDDLNASDASEVFISGGWIGDQIIAADASQITILGSNFEIDGVPVGYGEIGVTSGLLTGNLENGIDMINNNFYIDPDASIFLVPEPSTMLLVGLGALCLRRRNRI